MLLQFIVPSATQGHLRTFKLANTNSKICTGKKIKNIKINRMGETGKQTNDQPDMHSPTKSKKTGMYIKDHRERERELELENFNS